MKARRFAMAALFAAVLGALISAFAPTGQVVERYGLASGVDVTRSYSVSLFRENGPWVLVVVSVPVLLTLVQLVMRSRTAGIVSTVSLWIVCIAGLASVGIFFIPAAILMTVALSQRESAQSRPDGIPAGPHG